VLVGVFKCWGRRQQCEQDNNQNKATEWLVNLPAPRYAGNKTSKPRTQRTVRWAEVGTERWRLESN
jgi:hypothetical protein